MGLGNVRRVEAESAATLRTLRPDMFSGAGVVVVPVTSPVFNAFSAERCYFWPSGRYHRAACIGWILAAPFTTLAGGAYHTSPRQSHYRF
jgi:hypothetical protein